MLIFLNYSRFKYLFNRPTNSLLRIRIKKWIGSPFIQKKKKKVQHLKSWFTTNYNLSWNVTHFKKTSIFNYSIPKILKSHTKILHYQCCHRSHAIHSKFNRPLTHFIPHVAVITLRSLFASTGFWILFTINLISSKVINFLVVADNLYRGRFCC